MDNISKDDGEPPIKKPKLANSRIKGGPETVKEKVNVSLKRKSPQPLSKRKSPSPQPSSSSSCIFKTTLESKRKFEEEAVDVSSKRVKTNHKHGTVTFNFGRTGIFDFTQQKEDSQETQFEEIKDKAHLSVSVSHVLEDWNNGDIEDKMEDKKQVVESSCTAWPFSDVSETGYFGRPMTTAVNTDLVINAQLPADDFDNDDNDEDSINSTVKEDVENYIDDIGKDKFKETINVNINETQDKQEKSTSNLNPLQKEILQPKTIIQQSTTTFISSMSPEIDKAMNGGVQLGTFVEVVGMPATGKTSLSLQFCVSTQLSKVLGGLEGQSIIITSQKNLCTERLRQIASTFVLRTNAKLQEIGSTENKLTVNKIMDNIFIVKIRQFNDSISALQRVKLFLQNNDNVKLVVVDGIISSLFNVERSIFTDLFQDYVQSVIGYKKVGFIITNTCKTTKPWDNWYVLPKLWTLIPWSLNDFEPHQIVQLSSDLKDASGHQNRQLKVVRTRTKVDQSVSISVCNSGIKGIQDN